MQGYLGGINGLAIKVADGETKYYGVATKDLQENVRLTSKGIEGTLKFKDKFTEFSGDPEEQSGNFLALSFENLPQENVTKIETKVIGGKLQDYVDLTADKYCVYRITDKDTQEIEVKVTNNGKEESVTYPLEGLTCNDCTVGKDAFDETKTNYGRFGNTEAFYEGVKATWSGDKATVKGKLKWVDHTPYTQLTKDGHYFAFALKSDEFTGKDITIDLGDTTKTSQETDWVIFIDEARRKHGITVKYRDTVIARFDLSGVTLAAQGPEMGKISLEEEDSVKVNKSTDFFSFA